MADLVPSGPIRRYGERDVAIQEDQEAQRLARIAAIPPDQSAFKAGVYREDYGMDFICKGMLKGWSLFNTPNFPEDEEQVFTPDPDYQFDQDEANFNYPPNQMIRAKSA